MGFKVLILEDNKIDANLMRQYLERSNEPFDEIKLVHDKQSYEKALQNFPADLILSDYRLVNFTGLDAIKLKNAYCEEVPIIIVSATIGDEKAVELIKEGAVDYLIKNNAEKRLGQVAIRAIRESKEKEKRRQAEYSLKKSEQRYRMLFNSSIDGILIGRPGGDGKILDANKALCDLLGYSREELLQLERTDLFQHEGSDLPKLLHKREQAEEKEFIGELELRHKEGSSIPVEITSRIIKLSDGKEQTYSIIRDIRDRKKIEQQLHWDQKVQELQKDIAQIINKDLEFHTSLEACISRINSFLEWQLGHIFVRDSNGEELFKPMNVWYSSQEEHFGQFIEATQDKSFTSKEGIIWNAAKSQDPVVFDTSEASNFQRTNIAEKTQLETGLLVPIIVDNQAEAVLEFYSSTHAKIDEQLQKVLETLATQIARLIERKRHIDKLKEEKERFRLIAMNSTDMISRHTPEGEYLYVSPASEELMGYSPEEMVGDSAYNYFHPDDLQQIRESHQAVLEKPDLSTITYRIKQKSGGWCWVETSSKTLRDPESNEVIEIQSATRNISDRIEYEQKLKQQFKLNENIINSLPELFFIISSDRKLQRVNDQFIKIFGYSREEIKEMDPNDFVAEEHKELSNKSLKKAFAEGEVEVELNMRTKSGDIIPYLVNGTINELDGQQYLIGAGINISDRVKVEQELRKEKEFTENSINSLPGLFYVLDEQYNYVRVNNNMIESLGYSKEELNNMHPLDFYQEKDQKRITEAIERAFTKGDAAIVSQVKTKDGRLPWYHLTGAHFEQAGNNYILGTGIDITDRIQAEQELEQHEQLLQSIMDQAGAVIYVKKKDGTFLFINDEFLKLFDLKKEQVVGKRDIDIIDEDDVEIMRESDLQAIETGTSVELEETVQFDDQKRTYLSTKVPLKNVEGFEECVCGVSTDITERKQMEIQLRESLKEKEVLLLEIHHRVKNNLAVVSSMMQLQAFESDNEEVTSELNNSQSRIKSMALMHELLYQSKSFSKVDFSKNITELLEHISNSIQPEDIETNLDLESIELNINQAIPCSLILNELLVNIYKHAFPKGCKGHLHISLRESDGNVVLKVKDNGIGLPDDFDLEDPTTIGLRLVNVLSNQLNAELTYSSSSEETEFILVFEKMKIKGSASNLVE